jgi:hypothetical protein
MSSFDPGRLKERSIDGHNGGYNSNRTGGRMIDPRGRGFDSLMVSHHWSITSLGYRFRCPSAIANCVAIER